MGPWEQIFPHDEYAGAIGFTRQRKGLLVELVLKPALCNQKVQFLDLPQTSETNGKTVFH